nr:hypothetical protein [Shewanella sp. NIFS-20-20]
MFAPTAIAAENDLCLPTTNKAPPTAPITVGQITIEANDIFDESLDDSFFIHRWANALHINTKEQVIINQLSLEEGQQVTPEQIAEAERLLRAEPYIREAKITAIEPSQQERDCAEQPLLVQTWDNWSLLPTFSASRTGGENKFAIGLKEDNLLGLGVRTRVKYQSDQERTGYKFAFSMPINWIPHATLAMDFYDNSDGQVSHVLFTKPFYTLDGDSSYQLEYLDDVSTDTLEQNGEDINEFRHDIQFYSGQYGWLHAFDQQRSQRIIAGVTSDQHQFYFSPVYPNGPLPEDRDFLYPWLAWESVQNQFKVFNNIHLINHSEDINLGFYHYWQLGLETRDRRSSAPGYHLQGFSSVGFEQDDHLLFAQFEAKAVLNTAITDYYWAQVSAEYFYTINPKWSTYNKLRLSTSRNLPLDMPSALGDDTGLRGYSNDYQYGDQQWLLTSEIRHYPNINLFQLAELGWAAFADIGQAFGGNDANNAVTGPIGSVGIGARLFSSRSSYGHVAHIDLSVPITTGPNIDSWEWRFQVRNRF